AILARYFPGAPIGTTGPRLTAIPPSDPSKAPAPPKTPVSSKAIAAAAAVRDVLISLPDGDEGSRDELLTMTRRARDEIAARLQIQASPVVVRVHATTADYERSTGQPWFTAAAAAGGEVHVTPLAALRDRGMLERTLIREIARAAIDDVLARRPLWVRVG